MNLEDIYNKFPDKNSCIQFLEFTRWDYKPTCPYCGSNRYSSLSKEYRYHCNECNTSYSVTVGTMFHKTRLDFQKWFYSILEYTNTTEGISSRQLSESINTTKDTSWRILNTIRKSLLNDEKFINNLIDNFKNLENERY